jgi:hypothetical protein
MTTVYRLPEEPPIGTTVRPEPDTGDRWIRYPDGWGRARLGSRNRWSWLLDTYTVPLVVVEPDPHPTPWTVNRVDVIVDANGTSVFSGEYDDHRAAVERIVDAFNMAGTP